MSECVAAALVVSKSVDDARFRLQMEGIAEALEDPSVFSAITGNAGGILIAMVISADRPNLTMGWLRIASPANAAAAAGHAAAGGRTPLPRPDVPDLLGRGSAGAAERVVIDVSGDGIDNCTDAGGLAEAHAALLASGATVNGLPILVWGKNDVVGAGVYRARGYGLLPASLPQERTSPKQWCRAHVIRGPGAFLFAAAGFGDFARALRQKFVIGTSKLGR